MKFVFYNNDLLFLKHDPWIGFQIGHVNFLAILNDLWMFPRHQPADMRKEKSPICIVRIGVRIGVFMVLPMISHPNIQTVLVTQEKKLTRYRKKKKNYFNFSTNLTGQRVQPQEKYSEWQFGLERSMRPQTVRTHCDAQSRSVNQK